MKSTRTRRAFGAVFALSLVAAACGSDDDDSSDSGTVAEGTEASTADTAAEGTEGTTAEATDDTAAEGTDDSTAPAGDSTVPAGDSTAPAGDGVRLGIMAECEGAFGGFNEDVVAGATLALINEAGATSNSPDTALDGFTGAEVAGIPIELVGIGCGDDTADRAVQEIRTLVEQDGANVVMDGLVALLASEALELAEGST